MSTALFSLSRHHALFILMFGGLLHIALPVSAADPLGPDAVGVWELVKVSVGLVVVIGLIMLTASGVKRLKSLPGSRAGQMKILDGVSVSSRDRIVLLEVDHEKILLGVSPGRINALHVFTDNERPPTSFAEIIGQAEASATDSSVTA